MYREAVERGGADLDLGDGSVVVRLNDVFEVRPQLCSVFMIYMKNIEILIYQISLSVSSKDIIIIIIISNPL